MLPPGYYYPQAGIPGYPRTYAQGTYPQAIQAPAAGARAQAAAPAPAPKVRMQAPDEGTRSAKVVIPSPEQLGLVPSAGSVDWNATLSQLRQVGATCYQIDRVPAGGFHFTCWLPAEQAGKSYRIEADGTSEAEAVRLCLERADRWSHRSK